MRLLVRSWRIGWLEGAFEILCLFLLLKGLTRQLLVLERYFSNAIIACLQRSIAIPVWANLMNSADGTSLERALGAFDLFVPQCEIDSLDEVWLFLLSTLLLSFTLPLPLLS